MRDSLKIKVNFLRAVYIQGGLLKSPVGKEQSEDPAVMRLRYLVSLRSKIPRRMVFGGTSNRSPKGAKEPTQVVPWLKRSPRKASIFPQRWITTQYKKDGRKSR